MRKRQQQPFKDEKNLQNLYKDFDQGMMEMGWQFVGFSGGILYMRLPALATTGGNE